MKRFLVDLLASEYSQFIATRYLEITARDTQAAPSPGLRLMMCLVIATFVALLVLMLLCQVSMGSRSLGLWVAVAFVSLFEDICLLQPICIALNACDLDELTRADLVFVWRLLWTRFRHILNRRHGFMMHANSLVQHLNPACRSARTRPDLPVSRFLISLNDLDIPTLSARRSSDSRYVVFNALSWTGKAAAAVFRRSFYLPRAARTVLFHSSTNVAVNALILAIFGYGQEDPAAAAVLAALAVCVLALLWPSPLSTRLWRLLGAAAERRHGPGRRSMAAPKRRRSGGSSEEKSALERPLQELDLILLGSHSGDEASFKWSEMSASNSLLQASIPGHYLFEFSPHGTSSQASFASQSRSGFLEGAVSSMSRPRSPPPSPSQSLWVESLDDCSDLPPGPAAVSARQRAALRTQRRSHQIRRAASDGSSAVFPQPSDWSPPGSFGEDSGARRSSRRSRRRPPADNSRESSNGHSRPNSERIPLGPGQLHPDEQFRDRD